MLLSFNTWSGDSRLNFAVPEKFRSIQNNAPEIPYAIRRKPITSPQVQDKSLRIINAI